MAAAAHGVPGEGDACSRANGVARPAARRRLRASDHAAALDAGIAGGRRDVEEATRGRGAEARGLAGQARRSGPRRADRRPRGSRSPRPGAQGRCTAAAAGARRAGRRARGRAGAADRRGAHDGPEDRGLPDAQGGHEGAGTLRGGAGAGGGGGLGHRRRGRRDRAGDRAGGAAHRRAAVPRRGDRRAGGLRRGGGPHRRPDRPRPRDRGTASDERGRRRAGAVARRALCG